MHLVVAGALAVVAALVELTVAPYLRVGDAVPHIVLVLGVVTTVAGGVEVGLVWAFVGGLSLDILAQRPLGSSAFSLLVALGVAALIGGAVRRFRIAAPVIATPPASVVYSVLLLVATTALTTAPLTGSAFGGVLPSAVYDAIIAALVGPLVVAIMARREAERVDW